MRRTKTRGARVLAAAAVLLLAAAPVVAPSDAEARPGGGSSSGSRGSRTYSAPPSTNTAPGTTSNFNRTDTPRGGSGQQAPVGQTSPGYAGAPARSGFGGFGAGLMGGLLGAGLVGMLFGSGAFGGVSGVAGFLGFLLQIALVVGLIMLVVRFFRRRAAGASGGPVPAMAGGIPRGYAREMMSGNSNSVSTGVRSSAPASVPLQVTQKDFTAFEQALLAVNAAWSRGDAGALSRLSTPEMARYFAQDLRDLEARGWRNETRDVKLESGDLSEAWREGDREYATVAMRFGLVDVTRDATGGVVEGDPSNRQTATELWTFTRRQGSDWLVSAIQQSGR